jgi:hypothetical protein
MPPQFYWTGLGWSPQQTVGFFYDDAAQYNLLAQPIAPAYEDAPGARDADGDHAAFLDLVLQHGATGISVWSYEHLDDPGWQRAARAAAALNPPADPCADVKAQLADAQTTIATLQARITAAAQALAA